MYGAKEFCSSTGAVYQFHGTPLRSTDGELLGNPLPQRTKKTVHLSMPQQNFQTIDTKPGEMGVVYSNMGVVA